MPLVRRILRHRNHRWSFVLGNSSMRWDLMSRHARKSTLNRNISCCSVSQCKKHTSKSAEALPGTICASRLLAPSDDVQDRRQTTGEEDRNLEEIEFLTGTNPKDDLQNSQDVSYCCIQAYGPRRAILSLTSKNVGGNCAGKLRSSVTFWST